MIMMMWKTTLGCRRRYIYVYIFGKISIINLVGIPLFFVELLGQQLVKFGLVETRNRGKIRLV